MDFVKERAEENKTFFKLNSNEEKEKKMAEKENISTQQTLKQDKPRGFRRQILFKKKEKNSFFFCIFAEIKSHRKYGISN